MNFIKCAFLTMLLTICALSTTACSTKKQILSVHTELTLSYETTDVKAAIVEALATRNWVITNENGNEIQAKFVIKENQFIAVKISYTDRYYNINYLDSQNMKYNGSKIHKTYNKQVKALDKVIKSNVKSKARLSSATLSTAN
ncbi:MAG: hypothetical protein UHG91_07945 [Succinivibrionaceae bacterium]|nr:hypothetical protein [Ruminobacter sp.]MDY5780256.1 hypothetical protein [Succinivibrionaceae bacterium]MEE1340687.1 hypothetical protein [Succinivibrionaceae bacterium]